MVLNLPSAVPSMGTRRALFIPGPVANIDAITVTAANAATNISCYLTRQNGWAATADEAVIADSRYCSVQDFELPGAEGRTLSLQYTFNLNEPDDDEARLALAKGTEGVLVHFLQVDEDSETFATGDWYEAVPVRMGVQNIVAVEDNAVDRIQQKAFIRGKWSSFNQLVAA
jgi:hypothetical protein